MRLSISLEEDLYRVAKSLAKAEDISLSKAINRLIRKGLESVQQRPQPNRGSPASTFPVSKGCRPMEENDVHDLEVAEDLAKWNGS